jgi:hypothetical protein
VKGEEYPQHCSVTKGEFIHFLMICAKTLFHPLEFNVEKCSQIVQSDWDRDMGATFVTTISKAKFESSLFEIVDTWCITIGASDYVDFLGKLYSRITRNRLVPSYRMLEDVSAIQGERGTFLDDVHCMQCQAFFTHCSPHNPLAMAARKREKYGVSLPPCSNCFPGTVAGKSTLRKGLPGLHCNRCENDSASGSNEKEGVDKVICTHCSSEGMQINLLRGPRGANCTLCGVYFYEMCLAQKGSSKPTSTSYSRRVCKECLQAGIVSEAPSLIAGAPGAHCIGKNVYNIHDS